MYVYMAKSRRSTLLPDFPAFLELVQFKGSLDPKWCLVHFSTASTLTDSRLAIKGCLPAERPGLGDIESLLNTKHVIRKVNRSFHIVNSFVSYLSKRSKQWNPIHGFLFFSSKSMGFNKNLGGLAKMSWTIWRLWVLMESDLSGSWVDEGWRWGWIVWVDGRQKASQSKSRPFLRTISYYGSEGLGCNSNGFMVLRPLWFYYFDNLHSFLMLVESDLKIMSPDL